MFLLSVCLMDQNTLGGILFGGFMQTLMFILFLLLVVVLFIVCCCVPFVRDTLIIALKF